MLNNINNNKKCYDYSKKNKTGLNCRKFNVKKFRDVRKSFASKPSTNHVIMFHQHQQVPCSSQNGIDKQHQYQGSPDLVICHPTLKVDRASLILEVSTTYQIFKEQEVKVHLPRPLVK